jgi:hypothetical protein
MKDTKKPAPKPKETPPVDKKKPWAQEHRDKVKGK